MANERVTNLGLAERLDVLTQLVRDDKKSVDERWSIDQRRFATIEANVLHMKDTLDRIKGPIEAAISLKSFLLGLAALISAVGVLVGVVHYGVLQRLVSLFHP